MKFSHEIIKFIKAFYMIALFSLFFNKKIAISRDLGEPKCYNLQYTIKERVFL